MTITLDAVVLPDDLIWTDEFDWTPVQQSQEYTLSGALILDSGIKQAGRTMTLTGDVDAAWSERADIKAIYAKLPDDSAMTLTLNDGRVFNVVFDHAQTPLSAKPIIDFSTPDDADMYQLTLKFIQVAV